MVKEKKANSKNQKTNMIEKNKITGGKVDKLRKLIREEIEKELNNSLPHTITFSLPITLTTFFTEEDFETPDEWKEFVEKIKKGELEDAWSALDNETSDIETYFSKMDDSDIKISYDDDLKEGDYEISNKLSSSEIEKKKKDIKAKDPKATIAVKDPSLREVEDEDNIDDETVDKQAQKGAKKINSKASKLDRVTRDLVQLTNIMKEMAKKYQKAEGAEKEQIVADLKQKTKAKKELEALKAQLESGVVGKGGKVGLESDDVDDTLD